MIGVVSEEAKETSSTDGMTLTADTSPYFAPFVAAAPRDLLEATDAVLARDLTQLGRVAERSALRMHASAMAAFRGGLSARQHHRGAITQSLRCESRTSRRTYL